MSQEGHRNLYKHKLDFGLVEVSSNSKLKGIRWCICLGQVAGEQRLDGRAKTDMPKLKKIRRSKKLLAGFRDQVYKKGGMLLRKAGNCSPTILRGSRTP